MSSSSQATSQRLLSESPSAKSRDTVFSPPMNLAFTKMNGAGNDFILIDNRDGKIRLTTEQIVRLCHRQRGVGADGLFLLVPTRSGKADWAWDFYNNDGSTAEMC